MTHVLHLAQLTKMFSEMNTKGSVVPDVMVMAGMINEANFLLSDMEKNGCIADINSYNLILEQMGLLEQMCLHGQ